MNARTFAYLARPKIHGSAEAVCTSQFVVDGAWRQKRLLVLCYHGVSKADEDDSSDLYVSPEHLERRPRLLKRLNAPIVPFAHAVEQLFSGVLPPRAVALTLDDRAYDFGARAQPVISAHSVRSTLYITTWYRGEPFPLLNTTASHLLWNA